LFMPEGIFGSLVLYLNARRRRMRKQPVAPFPAPARERLPVSNSVLPLDDSREPRATIPALQVSGLSKHFGGLLATADVSFDVADRSLTALIGPNGAGKTTLFNLITNLFSASTGEMRLYGASLNGLSPVQIANLGLIRTFQTARVFPGMTVLENVMVGQHRVFRPGVPSQMFWLPRARSDERKLQERARELLRLVALDQFEDAHAADLPMGAQKLLEVIRALMSRPRLLLLDEPAAGLNDTETAELAVLLQAARISGVTVLLVEHNMPLVMGIADHVLVLEAGALIAAGPPAEIQRNERVITAYLGQEGAAA
jgi:branched-chain amino acid transport system ATP-binding protein